MSPRIRNPEVTGAPRPVEPLFGYDHWLDLFQIFTIISMLIIVIGLRGGCGAATPHIPCC